MQNLILIKKQILGTVGTMLGLPFVYREFFQSMMKMTQFNSEYLCSPGTRIHYIDAVVSLHAMARNALVKHMRGDWLFMVDADHMFKPNTLFRLLHMMEKYSTKEEPIEVLSGLYLSRDFPHYPILFLWDKKEKKFTPWGDWPQNAEIVQTDAAGGGCLLIRRTVFDRIKNELQEEPFSQFPGFGEDMSFFLRLRKLKIKAFVAPLIEANHLQTMAVKKEHYNAEFFNLDRPKRVKGAVRK